MGYVAAFALLACFATHAVLVVSLAFRKWWKALVGLVVPPLAVVWAWDAGMRWRVFSWLAAVVAYAGVVAAA